MGADRALASVTRVNVVGQLRKANKHRDVIMAFFESSPDVTPTTDPRCKGKER
jgi:hypothetical protein